MLGIAMLLGLLGFGGWLTRNPDAPILDRMETWRVVGPWATAFRKVYRPPPPPTAADEDPRNLRSGEPYLDGETIRVPAQRQVWTLAGTPLRQAPDPKSKIVRITEKTTRFPRLGRSGDWIRVADRPAGTSSLGKADSVGLWVYLPGYDERDPPLGEAPDPPGPLMPRTADAARLAKARALFGGRERVMSLGPYKLVTDVKLEGLLLSLERLAPQLDDAYARRYGRRPLGTPKETVLLFARPSDYRAAQDLSPSLHGLRSAGHTGRGIVFLYSGARLRSEILSTFVHETGHLLNRRALGPALPPWLDEGLADDFAAGRLDEQGTYRPELLNGTRLDQGQTVTHNGPTASLLHLHQDRHRLPSLETLVAYDRQAFLGQNARRHYDMAAFFVRFMLSTHRAEAFHDYLDTVAAGEVLSPETLRSRLDEPWSALDAEFRQWIVAEAEELIETG